MVRQRAQNTTPAASSADTCAPDARAAAPPAGSSDAGNRPNDHYKAALSPLRYTLRSWCLPVVREETAVLARLQRRVRCRWLDHYFAWTANFASHTFYVLMLPPSFWFGASTMGRDLVVVLGMGIYITGFLKDFLCLPRPRSPPLHRITMSSYTAQEYGWPSSHAANATAVTLVLMSKLWAVRAALAPATFAALAGALGVYYLSLIVGRLYCGMHGFFDISTGAVIGGSLFAFRYFCSAAVDGWLLFSERNNSVAGTLVSVAAIVAGYLFLIHIHPEPVDDCPCFDDSVAFVGVLMGLDLSHLMCAVTQYLARTNVHNDPLLIPFAPDCGVLVMAARFALGVSMVVAWKAVSKPVVFTLLPPVYKFVGVNIPRSNFIATSKTPQTTRQIRSQSLSNMEADPLEHLNDVLQSVATNETVSVGPSGDIDAYELMDYQSQHKKGQVQVKISGVYRARYDVEIIGRCIIYAGIACVTVWGMGVGVQVLGLV